LDGTPSGEIALDGCLKPVEFVAELLPFLAGEELLQRHGRAKRDVHAAQSSTFVAGVVASLACCTAAADAGNDMDTYSFDVVVIGAGIAGATAAAHLAADHRVALIEAEDAAGYHTTGRSAATWILNYGPTDIRVLTGLSRDFLERPPQGFAEAPLMSRRPVVLLAGPGQEAELEHAVAAGEGLRPLDLDVVEAMVPALRKGAVSAAATEEDASDIDVSALHQGFLRQLRTRGGTLALRNRSGRISRNSGVWAVETNSGAVFHAPVVVNAAGAWGDEVAVQAGVQPLGIVPRRRTAAIVDPAPWSPADWPMLVAVDESWYARPEARTRLLVSPADATDSHPHDVRPDELDVAVGIDRMQTMLDIAVTRVERSWAGLRTFTPDGSPAFGWDTDAPGFFWSVGQGGYGIQTSPAAGRLVADLVSGRDPGQAGTVIASTDPRRFARITA
jgi:D-arginine dehydrogenase